MLLKSWLWASRGRRNVQRAVRRLGPVDATLGPLVPGRSFVDVGAMWNVHGKIAFAAEELGATEVTATDVMSPTEEYEAERLRRGSTVRFVHGDIHDPAVRREIGTHDVVWCSGVLYHCPNPVHTIECLKQITKSVLVLMSAGVPEIPGVRNGCVYFPCLSASERDAYDAAYNAALQIATDPDPVRLGITTPFDAREGFGNWWWGLSPSAIESMLRSAGFSIEETKTNGFHTRVVARLERA
jgi:SAM-dependent methyltransferase